MIGIGSIFMDVLAAMLPSHIARTMHTKSKQLLDFASDYIVPMAAVVMLVTSIWGVFVHGFDMLRTC
jgi:hypothetical protein